MCIHNTHVLGVQFFGDSSGTYMGFKFAWQWIDILAFLSQQHGLINSDQDKLYDLLRHKMSERRLKDTALHWVTEGVVGKVSSDTRLASCNITWWRHQMETFSALLVFCAGNSPVNGELPAQRPVAWNFDVFFDLCLKQLLSKQWRGRWFETPPRSLWRHCHEQVIIRQILLGLILKLK